MPVSVQITRLRDIPLPAYMTAGSAAMDCAAAIEAPIVLPPHTPVQIPLGFAIALPSRDYVALMFGRSSMGRKYGVSLANSVGVIDSDYRGELSATLINLTDTPVTIEPGQRVAQLMIIPVATAIWAEVEALPESVRGEGGHGSTGY